ncbi:MAG: hypothetical protein KDI33_15670 [Halioglobus sp.]|nr:hypothetical protein [Halioglobus sp.]
MLTTFLTAIGAMIFISVSWLAVQRLWLRQFPERSGPEGDALSGRSGCHGCDCAPDDCQRK